MTVQADGRERPRKTIITKHVRSPDWPGNHLLHIADKKREMPRSSNIKARARARTRARTSSLDLSQDSSWDFSNLSVSKNVVNFHSYSVHEFREDSCDLLMRHRKDNAFRKFSMLEVNCFVETQRQT